MSIDISKLENVKTSGNKTVARCPACAEIGQDKKGNHLVISNDGKFACVMFQGASGYNHRKRIFHLVGIKGMLKNTISVKQTSQASHDTPEVVMDDVLGRIGRTFSSYPKKQPEPERKELVDCLLAKELLSEVVKQALDVFNGSVVSLV